MPLRWFWPHVCLAVLVTAQLVTPIAVPSHDVTARHPQAQGISGHLFADYGDFWFLRFFENILDYLLVIAPIGVFVFLVKRSLLPDRVLQNKYVKLVVFGVTRDQGMPYMLLDKKLPLVNSDLDESSSSVKSTAFTLVYCFVGLQLTYLTWGVLQEKIMTQNYQISRTFLETHRHQITDSLISILPSESGSTTSIKFRNAQFLVFVNRILAFWLAVCVLIYQNRGSLRKYLFTTNQPPLYLYMHCSLSNIMSSWCQYEALKYISFPAQVLSKGCKMIPVMLMSQFLQGKTHKRTEWLFALSISLGMTVFLFNEHQELDSKASQFSHSSTSLFSGLLILALYLTFDSFTSNWQQSLFDQHGISSLYMMAMVNLYSVLFTVTSLLQQSDFIPALSLLLANGTLLRDCFLLSICSAAGQLIIFYTISTFGAVVFTLIMTLRQAFAILLSCFLYSHPISLAGAFGIFIIFMSLFTKSYLKLRVKRPKPSLNGKHTL